MKKIDFKTILNPSQYKVVNTIDGPLLVVAGAGTGKTRVIEYRVLNLILKGVNPSSILLLTFTRKAAREMLDRASRHNKLCQQVEGGTFHSFAYKIIKRYRRYLGFKNNISFLDEADSADALHLLATRLGLLDKKLRFPKKNTLRNIISMSINRSQNIKSVLERDYPHFLDLRKDLEKLHKAYIDYKVNHSVIDYDDMLLYLKFLLENEEILKKISSRFSYVMVDEFQDTNKLQAEIVYLLGKVHQNVMAVGDDTQSIYSFRGAYYKNMFDFPKKFSNCKILKLEHNYRSTQPILDVANAIIEGEKQKYTKVLFTVKKEGTMPELNFFKDAYKEADFIANKIKQLYDQGTELSAVGILYRSNHNSLPLQLALSKIDIPFIVYGGIRFIETAHVKDVLSFMKVQHNRNDELAWNRILMLLEGIGPRTAERIYERILNSHSLDRAFKEFLSEQKISKELNRLLKLFQKINDKKKISIPDQLRLIKDFYFPIMKKKFDDYHLRSEDLRALIQISSEYSTVEEFLVDFVALEPPERSVVNMTQRRIDESPIVLSTIHSAKGLEWGAVFIISLIDGSLPVSYSLEDQESLEEERRLLYVAVTRAKSKLFLSMHNQGQNGGIFSFNRLSRFINEKKVLDKLHIDYNKFEKLEDECDLVESVDVNEDDSTALRRLYDYFEY
ncbi:MAG: ATP-dependent helicase [Candidatus Omnitrophica bacterium]|nr:ATP-dependent helicase [Candidatus Omnitrophota bacterium]